MTSEHGTRTSGEDLKDRREKVAQCLRKGLRSPTAIATLLGIKIRAVKTDIKYLEKESDVWLTNLAMGGYVHDIQNAVEALEALEVQLYAMRDDVETKKKPWLYLKVVRMIQESIALRVNLETKGPILIKLRQVRDKIASADKMALKVKE